VVPGEPRALPADRRPTPGPIAVLPEPDSFFTEAVEAAGGRVAELSGTTRGVVWLSNPRAAELAHVLDTHSGVEWVQLPWAGIDAFAPTIHATAGRRLLWTSAKGCFAQPVAEHALALILALLRVLPKRARATSWNDAPEGRSLYGRTVVVIGAGGIAWELLRLLEPFGVESIVVRRHPDPVPGATRTVPAGALQVVLPEADIVVVAAALTAETRHLIGAAELDLMTPTAQLVNVGRGALVDTDALVSALARGQIAGAALDVTDPEPLPPGHPLWAEPRCLITPHMADTPDMTAPLLRHRIEENVRAFLGDGRFVGAVDPELGY
jgi:phosphoglycerate dehydrogenase-like enzyme